MQAGTEYDCIKKDMVSFGRFLYDIEFMDHPGFSVKYLRKNTIDTQILSISLATGEIGNKFRITSSLERSFKIQFPESFAGIYIINGLGFDIKKQDTRIYFEVAAVTGKRSFWSR